MGLGEMFLDREKVFDHYLVCVFHYLNRKHDSVMENFRRRIEERCGIRELEKNDFRRTVAAFFGQLDLQNKKFDWQTNPHLKVGVDQFVKDYPMEDVPDHSSYFGKGRFRSIDDPWEAS